MHPHRVGVVLNAGTKNSAEMLSIRSVSLWDQLWKISQLMPDFQIFAHQGKRQKNVARHVSRVKDQGKLQLAHLQEGRKTRVRKV